MKAYTDLTERGQARRLRPLALNALAQYDLPVARLRLITNSFNGIFRLDTRGGDKFVLRITWPPGGHTRDHVTAEMDWLAALARDTLLHVPRPLAARDGAFIVEASAPGVPEPRLCQVFSWVPGVNLAKHITPANLFKLGALMAGLHQHALAYRPDPNLDLLRFNRVIPFSEPLLLFEPEHAALMPPARRALFQEAWARAQDAIDRLTASGEPMRILHGDLHQWNVRWFRGQLFPIDFEDLIWGWPVQDIGVSLYYFIGREDYPALRAAFQAGYESIAPWPEHTPGEVNAFICARALMMVNFVLSDPNAYWKTEAPPFFERVEGRLRNLA